MHNNRDNCGENMKAKLVHSLLVVVIAFGFAFAKPQIMLGQIKAEEKPELKEVFDEYKVDGTFVLFDLKRNRFTRYNSTRARQKFLPLSTFKIPNSLIALETGIVADENAIVKWSGARYEIDGWNKDLTFSEALSSSCVPCYQQIARRIGELRMKKFLKRFTYGNRDISGGIDRFWLDGGLRISADQEIEFLRRFFTGKLPVSKRATEIVKKMLVLENQANYKLSGKTGLQLGLSLTGVPQLSIPVSPNLGWFVGYLEQNDNVYFFATNIESANPPENFSAARIEITKKILQRLGFL
jgi:beta-lactamase class D